MDIYEHLLFSVSTDRDLGLIWVAIEDFEASAAGRIAYLLLATPCEHQLIL